MTWFDLLVVAILALSIGFAAVRGAIRELATLLALGLAALATWLLFNPLLGVLSLKGSLFGMMGLVGVLGLIFFVLFYIGTHIGLKNLSLTKNMVMADMIGGAGFGLLRGLALIGLGFLAYAFYQDEATRPDAINKALLLPVAQGSANFFEGMAPTHDSKDIISPEDITDKIDSANKGYARGDRAALNEIVTTTTTSTGDAVSEAQNVTYTEDQIADILIEDNEGEQ